MRKNPMPYYYGRNIVRHAQKKFLQCKALEGSQEKRLERNELCGAEGLYELEKRSDEYGRGGRDSL